jgi:hypothetical protein
MSIESPNSQALMKQFKTEDEAVNQGDRAILNVALISRSSGQPIEMTYC